MIRYNKSNKPLARNLRKAMTEPEILLWSRLKNKNIGGAKFRRQMPIGGYIADFCCIKSKLIVELDGSGHYLEEGKQKDAERDGYLKSKGFRVLRFANSDILNNFDLVLENIYKEIAAALPPTAPTSLRYAAGHFPQRGQK
ncbi:MAG: endonuclease domain-containing protein [Elusimicrobiota bacterium]|jgi:very-short-patch-repair endonuclease|nr:endonuclease domain-containing protein [Elusimicrobiota bacterium]